MFNIRMIKNSQNQIEKQIIRFHYNSTQNTWHGYELREDFQARMGSKIMKKFKKDDSITHSEYTDLIKNKWKK